MALFNINVSFDGDGFVELEFAGETLTAGDLCYLGTDSKYYKANAGAKSTSTTELRIALVNIPINTSGTFLIKGKYNVAGLTSGSKYYIDLVNGGFSTTQPGATNVVRYIGTAYSTTVLEFNPDETYVLADGTEVNDITFAGGGGSAHIIQEEGSSLTPRTNLNFIGAGVVATDNSGASATDVTIAGGGTIAGSITNDQVAIGATTADEIEGSTGLTYTAASQTLGLSTAESKIDFSSGDGHIEGASGVYLRVPSSNILHASLAGLVTWVNIEPNINNAYTLGQNTERWANIYSVLGNFSSTVEMADPTIDAHGVTLGYLNANVVLNPMQSALDANYKNIDNLSNIYYKSTSANNDSISIGNIFFYDFADIEIARFYVRDVELNIAHISNIDLLIGGTNMLNIDATTIKATGLSTANITDAKSIITKEYADANYGGGGGGGTVTSVTVGTGLDVTNSTTTPNITVDLSEFGAIGTGVLNGATDYLMVLDNTVEQKILLQDFELGLANNSAGWTTNLGTVTSVTAGTGLDSSGGTIPNITMDLNELPASGTLIGTDDIVVVNGTASQKEQIDQIPLSIFNNDAGWDIGNVTSSVTPISDRITLWNGGKDVTADDNFRFASNNLILDGGAGINAGGNIGSRGEFNFQASNGIPQGEVFYDATLNGIKLQADNILEFRGSKVNIWRNGVDSGIEIASDGAFASVNSVLAISSQLSTSKILITKEYAEANYAGGVGTITGVTAGTGLTGGGTSGSVTLNVIGGSGINANANDITLGALTANWDAGGYEIRARTLESDVATGTAPFTVTSTTKVTNLNSDTLDGLSSTSFLRSNTADIMTAGSLTFNDNIELRFGTLGVESEISSNGTDTTWKLKNGDIEFLNSVGISQATIADNGIFNTSATNAEIDLNSGNLVTKDYLTTFYAPTIAIGFAISDETTALTTGISKTTFRMPHGLNIDTIKIGLTTAQVFGSLFTVDVNHNGTSILSTKLTIDNTEKTSVTAVSPPVLSNSLLVNDSEITVDIDQIGTSGAKGLKLWIIGTIPVGV